jgi:hypothetical protein
MSFAMMLGVLALRSQELLIVAKNHQPAFQAWLDWIVPLAFIVCLVFVRRHFWVLIVPAALEAARSVCLLIFRFNFFSPPAALLAAAVLAAIVLMARGRVLSNRPLLAAVAAAWASSVLASYAGTLWGGERSWIDLTALCEASLYFGAYFIVAAALRRAPRPKPQPAPRPWLPAAGQFSGAPAAGGAFPTDSEAGSSQGDGILWKAAGLVGAAVTLCMFLWGLEPRLAIFLDIKVLFFIAPAFLLLLWSVFLVEAHFWKQAKGGETEAASPAPAAGARLGIPRISALIMAHFMLLVVIFFSTFDFFAMGSYTLQAGLGAAAPIVFDFALWRAHRRFWVLAIPAALDFARFVFLFILFPDVLGFAAALLAAAALAAIALMARGRLVSNRPLLAIIAAAYIINVMIVTDAFTMIGWGWIPVHDIGLITLYFGAYFIAAAAAGRVPRQKPQTQSLPRQPSSGRAFPPRPEAGSGAGQKEFPPFTRGGLCEVCGGQLHGKKAYAVPRPLFYASQKYHDWFVQSQPAARMGRLMDPELALKLQAKRDARPALAVCGDCVHLFR